MLSLSKHCPFFEPLAQFKKEVQPFDKLRVDGFWLAIQIFGSTL